jgi:NADPH2:quinone reductase
MISGQAWRVMRFGEPEEAIEAVEQTWTEPEAGQVLIRVRTAGAGYPDAMMTAGAFPLLGKPPFGLGEEAAGEVLAVAAGSRFVIGDQVTGITAFLQGWGGYAEYAYLLEHSMTRIPAGMTDEQAGGFPIGFRTAYAGLVERAALAAGETVLVLGAAGSSGSTAVQLAKALGAKVIAVAGRPDKAEFIARRGADHVINHRHEDVTARITEITGGRGVNLIYDPVGGALATTAMHSLGRNGRIAVTGLASGAPATIDPLALMLGNHSAVGVLAVPLKDNYAEDAVWDRLARLAADGAITTPVGAVYDFEDVPLMVAEQAKVAPGKAIVRVTKA